jgi:hypothetical protein
MSDFVAGLIVIAAVALFMFGLTLLAIRVRRSGSADRAVAAALAAYDEAMNSTAYTTLVEVRAQEDRRTAIPAPGEPSARKLRKRAALRQDET